MSSVFEIIEALKAYRGMTFRDIAEKTGRSYTTLTSIMSRRSARIPVGILTEIASALEVDVCDLIPLEVMQQESVNKTGRYSTEFSKDFVRMTLHRIIGDDYEKYLPEYDIEVRTLTTPRARPSLNTSAEHDARYQFKQSINFVLNKLNDRGLMEVMRLVLEVANDPKYYVSTDSEKKEDNGWQKEEQ